MTQVAAPMKAGAELTVWYDGACPLCRREMQLMRRLDRRDAISFVDVTSAGANLPAPKADLLRRLHVREDGHLVSGAGAFAAMWRAIPLLRPLGLLARVPLVLGLLERAYTAFLRVRPKLQRAAKGGRTTTSMDNKW
jgi:predicted DCC family thiol-disulfide oxidoreductase YuxK